MPTIDQAFEFYREARRKGKGHLHTGHCYIAEEEAQKRERGEPDAEGKPKTKIAWDSCDAESYAEWHKVRRIWMDAAHGNPTLATDAMIVALKAYSAEGIQAILDTLGAMRAEQAGVPHAEIPKFDP